MGRRKSTGKGKEMRPVLGAMDNLARFGQRRKMRPGVGNRQDSESSSVPGGDFRSSRSWKDWGDGGVVVSCLSFRGWRNRVGGV